MRAERTSNSDATPLPGEAAFKWELLSVRERQVVEQAMSGQTDEQIARALSLSPSTVGSYWIRIRHKVGSFNRTELVSRVLREQALQNRKSLVSDIENFREVQPLLQARLDKALAENAALRGMSWHLLALDHLPDAVVVTMGNAVIEFANVQAGHFFAAEPGELVGRTLWNPDTDFSSSWQGEEVRSFYEGHGSSRLILGIDAPYFSRRLDGSVVRATVRAERFEAPRDLMIVATIRPFMEDVIPIVTAFQKPILV